MEKIINVIPSLTIKLILCVEIGIIKYLKSICNRGCIFSIFAAIIPGIAPSQALFIFIDEK